MQSSVQRRAKKGKESSTNNVLSGLVATDQAAVNDSLLPSKAAIEIQTTVKDIQTKRDITEMIKPLVTGFTESHIHTTKLQIDYDALASRVQQLEVVFNAG